jgi:hypothetical protein
VPQRADGRGGAAALGPTRSGLRAQAVQREKRKLDNTTFLPNQVQKLAADLHRLEDQNRKLADRLENSLWDDRLDSYSASGLQQVASQVLRKKKEVAELLAASSSAAGEEESDRSRQLIMQPDHDAVDAPACHMDGAVSSPFDIFDLWPDGMGESAPASGFLCQQPGQPLPPEPGILVPRVT